MKEKGYKTAAIGKCHLGLGWQLKEGKDNEAFGLDLKDIEEKEPEYQKGRQGNFGNTGAANTSNIGFRCVRSPGFNCY